MVLRRVYFFFFVMVLVGFEDWLRRQLREVGGGWLVASRVVAIVSGDSDVSNGMLWFGRRFREVVKLGMGYLGDDRW